MNKEEMRTEMRVHIVRKYKNQSAAAKAWGVSPAFVSAVLKGKKNPTESMLKDAGLKRVEAPVKYVRDRA